MSRKIRHTRLASGPGGLDYGFTQQRFSRFAADPGWQPDVNVYRCEDHFEVWVDLAGVAKSEIRVDVFADRLKISGERQPPMPSPCGAGACRQVIAMEIESGHFSREVVLPGTVEQTEVTAKHENGLLRIVLPMAG